MDSHEARELLRGSCWPGYHVDEDMAMGILLADVHGWMEDCMNRWKEHDENIDRITGLTRTESDI